MKVEFYKINLLPLNSLTQIKQHKNIEEASLSLNLGLLCPLVVVCSFQFAVVLFSEKVRQLF